MGTGLRQDGFKVTHVSVIKTSASARYAKLMKDENESFVPVRDSYGLFLHVFRSNGVILKRWVVQVTRGEEIQRITIGEHPGMTLVKARFVGAAIRDEVIRSGMVRIPYVRSRFANYIMINIKHLMRALNAAPKPACFEVVSDPSDVILFRFDAALVLALIDAGIPYEVTISREDE